MSTLTFASIMLALSSAFLLYGLSYDTRLMEQRVQAAERAAERTRNDIAVLRAERAYLSRPERIEPFARALGLRPANAGQYQAPPAPANVADAAGQ